MVNETIKVTIIVPCFNSEKWIKECLLSALNQTYENTEVIFVDNESTDNSYQVATEIQLKFPNLKISTAKNIYRHSYQEPVEEGLRISSGDYFTILGSDDFLDREYVSNIVNILNKTDKILALQTPIRTIRGKEKIFDQELSHEYVNLEEFKKLLFQRCPVNTPSIVLSKKLYTEGLVRWKSDEYLGACDYELYFNLADKNIFVYPYPKWIGYYYRWHADQCTWEMHKENTNFDNKIRKAWRNKWNWN